MQLINIEHKQSFQRDGFTWLGYFLIGAYSYSAVVLGPLVPYLRSDLHLSYTTAAIHMSSLAFGITLAGLVGNVIMRRFGYLLTMWTCAAGLGTSVTILAGAGQAFFTILAVWLTGICGSVMGQTVVAIMSDRFGRFRSIGISEANIGASICSFIAPLMVSFCVRCGLSWRAALAIPIVVLVFLYIRFKDKKLPLVSHPAEAEITSEQLPVAYWLYWAVIVLSVSCEWSIVFWSAEFLEHIAKLVRVDAAASVSCFLIAMLVGRIIGNRLLHQYDVHSLLPIASMVALTGFCLFWLGTPAYINLIGLFVTGLGIANFYPLSVSAALTTASKQTRKATARLSLGSGLAILCAPFTLGYMADHTSIFTAYGLIAVLLSACPLMVFLANYYAKRAYR